MSTTIEIQGYIMSKKYSPPQTFNLSHTQRKRLVAQWIEFRISNGYSQKQAANKIGVAREAITLMENNYRKPSSSLITKISALMYLSNNVILKDQ